MLLCSAHAARPCRNHPTREGLPKRTAVLDQEEAAMANHTMEQPPADMLKTLIATEANRRQLSEVLGLGIDFDLPTKLSELLDALDEEEARATSDRREHH
jgi:hypothetical protein